MLHLGREPIFKGGKNSGIATKCHSPGAIYIENKLIKFGEVRGLLIYFAKEFFGHVVDGLIERYAEFFMGLDQF